MTSFSSFFYNSEILRCVSNSIGSYSNKDFLNVGGARSVFCTCTGFDSWWNIDLYYWIPDLLWLFWRHADLHYWKAPLIILYLHRPIDWLNVDLYYWDPHPVAPFHLIDCMLTLYGISSYFTIPFAPCPFPNRCN